ncbi:hypothetical protein ACX0G9_23240 [Flavitalea flava]
MQDLEIITDKINALRRLSEKDGIYLDDLREEFRQDLQSFIVGETLTIRKGQLFIGKNLYKQWLYKIGTKGFDYEIDFK